MAVVAGDLLAKAAGTGRMRGIGVALWRSGVADRARAAATWSRGLREARALHSAERRLVADLLHTLVKTERGLCRVLGTDDPDALWSAALARAGVADAAFASVPAAFDALGTTPREALRWHHSWPDAFADRMLALLGDAAPAFARALDARAPLVLRVNRSRATVERVVETLQTAGLGAVCAGGAAVEVTEGRGAEATAAFRDGWFEVQDLGSQRLGALVGATPTDVLDLCAGAGGKALQLADLGHRVTAVDPRARALEALAQRAARARLRVERHVGADGDAPALAGRTFGAVLVDAPCTGTGTWRRQPTLRWTWSPEQEAAMAVRQAHLLARGAAFVAPGGRLVYGTCSVARAEDEAVVEAFTATHSAFDVVETLRTWTHVDGTDGFFGAVLARRQRVV